MCDTYSKRSFAVTVLDLMPRYSFLLFAAVEICKQADKSLYRGLVKSRFVLFLIQFTIFHKPLSNFGLDIKVGHIRSYQTISRLHCVVCVADSTKVESSQDIRKVSHFKWKKEMLKF